MASDEGWVWSFEECGFPRVISPDAAIVMKVGFHAAGELDTIVGHKTAELGRTGRAWSHPRQAGRPAGPGRAGRRAPARLAGHPRPLAVGARLGRVTTPAA